MAKEFTEANFDELLSSNKVVVADFWATWCGPCKAMGPSIDELAAQYEGQALIGKVDVEENKVKIDVNIIVEYGARIPDVAFDIQTKVKKSVEAMTGLKVLEVNVHIQSYV